MSLGQFLAGGRRLVKGRDAKADLLSLLEVVEEAIRQGAIFDRTHVINYCPDGAPTCSTAGRAGARLVDAFNVLRRWWP